MGPQTYGRTTVQVLQDPHRHPQPSTPHETQICRLELDPKPVQGTEEQKAGGRQVLADCLEAVRIVAVLLAPITPSLSARIYAQLGFDEASHRDLCLDHAQWGGESPAAVPTAWVQQGCQGQDKRAMGPMTDPSTHLLAVARDGMRGHEMR